MQSRQHILVIMDKPKHPQHAFERALTMQARNGAHLDLKAFVYHPMVDQAATFDTHQRRKLKAAMLRERTEWLRGQVLDAGAAFDDVSIEAVWSKDLAGCVAQAAASLGYDLVVKSVHSSRRTLAHTPTDWALLRDCRAPVLLVTGRSWARKPVVLATLDLQRGDSAHLRLNKRVLEAAQRLATTYGGTVHCVHAIEISRVLADLDIIPASRVTRRVREAVAEPLRELLAPYRVPAARVHMPTGKVGQVVSGVARKINADLVVMGTTARHGLQALAIGNSAERVLAKVPCDVLALKP
jgi:universal stress protein E